jgi:hypothetical protein
MDESLFCEIGHTSSHIFCNEQLRAEIEAVEPSAPLQQRQQASVFTVLPELRGGRRFGGGGAYGREIGSHA